MQSNDDDLLDDLMHIVEDNGAQNEQVRPNMLGYSPLQSCSIAFIYRMWLDRVKLRICR